MRAAGSLVVALLAGVAAGLIVGLACLGIGAGLGDILRGIWSLVVFLATGRFVEFTQENDRIDWMVARIAGIIGCVGAGGMCFGLVLCERLENAQAADAAERSEEQSLKGIEISMPGYVLRQDRASGTWTTEPGGQAPAGVP